MGVRKDTSALHTRVFNSLAEHVALIDDAGTIIDVNAAWTKFGIDNGIPLDYTWRGKNYLDVAFASRDSGDALAGVAADGIVAVMEDRCPSFHLEYPCHSPDYERWFVMKVSMLELGSRPLAAIFHTDITDRKMAIERAEHLAMHDSLTGLANRRKFDQTLDGEFRRCARARTPISLIAVDIDNFKDYNDRRGHVAGDRCLEQFSHILRAFARRPRALAARLGGDEFALILGASDAAGSLMIAKAVLQSFIDLRVVFDGSRQVTASAGVASFIASEQEHCEILVHEADKALYRAKQSGRNRVVHADAGGDTRC